MLLLSVNLTALRKKDGGIRSVKVCNVARRFEAKGCYAISRAVSYELSPIQLGVSVNGGLKLRFTQNTFITNNVFSDDTKVIVKADMQNLFNSVRRDHVKHSFLAARPRLQNWPFSPTANRFQSLIFVIRCPAW